MQIQRKQGRLCKLNFSDYANRSYIARKCPIPYRNHSQHRAGALRTPENARNPVGTPRDPADFRPAIHPAGFGRRPTVQRSTASAATLFEKAPALQLQHFPRLRQRLFDSPRPSLSLANPIAPFRQSAKGWKARSRKRRADNESMRTRSEASKSCETRSPPRPAPSQTVPRPHFPASFPPRPTRRGAPPPRARRARAPHAKPTPIRARPGFAPGVQRPSARSPNPHVAPARQTNSPAAARLLRPRRARRSAIGNPHRSLRLRRRRTSAGSEASPRRSPARGSFSPPRRARRPRTGRDRALRAP